MRNYFLDIEKRNYKETRPHAVGRPPILTTEMIEEMCDLIIQGKTIAEAAILRGVSESSIYRWLAQGKKPDSEPIYMELVDRIYEAVECSEIEMLQTLRIASQAPKNWRAAAWTLERRWPERWGKKANPSSPASDIPVEDAEPNLTVVPN
jgi:hypothetical protein